jgi:hypothetical protein
MNGAKAKLLNAKWLNNSHFLQLVYKWCIGSFFWNFALAMPSKKLIAINKKLS